MASGFFRVFHPRLEACRRIVAHTPCGYARTPIGPVGGRWSLVVFLEELPADQGGFVLSAVETGVIHVGQ